MKGQTNDKRTSFLYPATRLGLVLTLLLIALGIHSAGPFEEQAKLLAADGALDDFFGSAVALEDDTALVGAYGDDDLGRQSGSAYVFARSGEPSDPVWTQQQKLLPDDGAARDFFGRSVAIDGDTAVVGAPRDDLGGRIDAGSAYVFVRTGSPSDPHWTQQAKLVADDGQLGDEFGCSVAISGNTALVGAHRNEELGYLCGAAYVFVRDGSTWMQQAKLLAADCTDDDHFGNAVALSGDTALIGASGWGVDDEGAAHIYVRTGSTWTRQAQLVAAAPLAHSHFGNAVAVEGDTALIAAAWGHSAYIFVRAGASWTQQAKLARDDGGAEDLFGYSVALSGDQALVGALNNNAAGAYSGAAYLFGRTGSTWTQQAKLVASDGAVRDQLGSSVGLAGDTALIGAHHDDDLGSNSGSAYVFVALPEPPVLHVSPPSLDETLLQDTSVTRTLTLSNGGEIDLTFELSTLSGAGSAIRIQEEVLWLSVEPVSGTVPGGGEQAIAVTLDAAGAGTGDHDARIRVQSNDLLTPTLDVPVTLAVLGEDWNEVPCDVDHLIAALNIANGNGTPDTLDLAAGCTYTLIESDNETDGPNGLPSITSAIVVNGNEATIERRLPEEDEWPIQDPFRIFHVAASGDLTLKQLTVRQGRGVIGADLPGGYGIANRGTLTLIETTLSGNQDQEDSMGCGGGLYNFASASATLVESWVTHNGVGRHSAGGGGICNDGEMELIDSTVSSNGGPSGGGIVNKGTLEIVRSTVSGNSAFAFYGEMAGSGGGIVNEGTLIVRSSTVSGNDTWDSGGGIWNERGTVTVIDSTVTSNSIDEENSGCAGICGGAVALRNTIVANQAYGSDCAGVTLTSLGYNLDGDGSCDLDQPTDQPSTDPLIGPLQDNGGPTETHALGAGSPAVDQGSCRASATDQRGLPRHVDAPGVANADDGCDVGAYEAQSGDPMGQVKGTVTDAATSEPLAATIALLPTTYRTATDPADGSYAFWWAGGAYDVQVSATDYVTQTVPVQIVPLQTLTQDFELVRPGATWRLYLPLVIR